MPVQIGPRQTFTMTCTAFTPAPTLKDQHGYLQFNHSYRHPDATVTNILHEEGYLKGNDLVLVTPTYPTHAQAICPHCRQVFGYNRNVFLSEAIPDSFWRDGEHAAQQRFHNRDYSL